MLVVHLKEKDLLERVSLPTVTLFSPAELNKPFNYVRYWLRSQYLLLIGNFDHSKSCHDSLGVSQTYW